MAEKDSRSRPQESLARRWASRIADACVEWVDLVTLTIRDFSAAGRLGQVSRRIWSMLASHDAP